MGEWDLPQRLVLEPSEPTCTRKILVETGSFIGSLTPQASGDLHLAPSLSMRIADAVALFLSSKAPVCYADGIRHTHTLLYFQRYSSG